MVWVIIGCTILIIVCLGGGQKLAEIVRSAFLLIGIVVVLIIAKANEVDNQTIATVVLVIAGIWAFCKGIVWLRAKEDAARRAADE